jgi:formylmethanofuran dehydrogenase subunit C
MSEMINLYPIKGFRFPVIAECIKPDVLEGKNRQEIEDLEIWEGNKQRRLRELFKVEVARKGQGEEGTSLAIHGDVSKVRRIGAGMSSGNIAIGGDAGTHLGEEMRGGRITVHGNVEGWAGSMMKGGTIEIHGNVSNYLAAPYRGSSRGMHGGEITVYGNAGNEVGAHMNKGLIKIYGSAGQFAGFRMHKGTIYVQKNCGGRAGACMKNGKIVVGGLLESILPTFTIDGIKRRVKISKKEVAEGPFYRFLGDLTQDGRGKLYVVREKNPQLSHYEKFL